MASVAGSKGGAGKETKEQVKVLRKGKRAEREKEKTTDEAQDLNREGG